MVCRAFAKVRRMYVPPNSLGKKILFGISTIMHTNLKGNEPPPYFGRYPEIAGLPPVFWVLFLSEDYNSREPLL